jgi:hypothetical protein
MATLERRVGALERRLPAPSSFVAQLQAARLRWRDDPEGAARDQRQRVGAFIAACEARIAAGERLTEQENRRLRARQRVSEAQT